MRARVFSRKNRKGITEGLWQSFLGPQKSAAKLRRWAFIAIILISIVFLLVNAPGNISSFTKWIFSAKSFGHIISFFLALWIGLQSAALAQSAIYSMSQVKDARKHILQNALGFPRTIVELHADKKAANEMDEAIENIGGPGKLHIQMDSAVLLESSWGSLNSVGPSSKAIDLDSFERIRLILDLRDQVINLNIWGRTKDGIRVNIEGARIVYSIARGNKEADLSSPYPFSKAAALRIGKIMENDNQISSKGNNSDIANPIGAHGEKFFERELQLFIGNFWLGELLASPSKQSLEEEGQKNSLFLARDSIRKQFIKQSRANALEHGFQIHWIDIGTWKVDKLAQSILQDYQDENYMEDQFLENDLLEQNKNSELGRLFGELVKSSSPKDHVKDEESFPKQVFNAYFGLIDGLRLRYGNLLSENNGQLSLLLRYLKFIGKNPEEG